MVMGQWDLPILQKKHKDVFEMIARRAEVSMLHEGKKLSGGPSIACVPSLWNLLLFGHVILYAKFIQLFFCFCPFFFFFFK